RSVSSRAVAILVGLGCAGLGCTKERSSEKSPSSAVDDVKKSAHKSQLAAPDTPAGKEHLVPLAVRQADYAITKIELGQAAELLEGEVGPDAARARARLAIYLADCEG